MMQDKTMILLGSILSDLKNSSPTPTASAEAAHKVVNGVTTSGRFFDSFIQMISLAVLLIVILIATYYTTKFVGGIKMGQLKDSNFKVIDAYRVGPNKVMQIVKIGNKYIVIAVSKDTINFITELDEAEVYIREAHTQEKLSFKQTLDKLKNMNK